jgi:poly-beta-1,6-N-acetyl-D-glucosamine N-deacetylase
MRRLMFSLLLWLPLLAGLLVSAPESAAQMIRQLATDDGQPWVAVSWHDVVPDADQAARDPYAVTTAELARQFDYLRDNGWQPVSLRDIIAAHQGEVALPERAVLLTFDDGLASHYSQVFPLLQAYDYPAVFALVTSWLEQDADWQFEYEGALRGRDGFLSWAQLREMLDSGLVEVASHSHDLHLGVLANPQGNVQPAAVTRQFLLHPDIYETEAQWRQRVTADLALSAEIIERRTGVRPEAIVWPYGEYNAALEAIAGELGMVVSLGLTSGVNSTSTLQGLNRLLISGQPDLPLFASLLPQQPRRPLQRVAHVDLDYVYDEDPLQELRNLDALIERIASLEINKVYLQAFADPDGDGNPEALYFPNRHLPVRRDLFNRVAWQLRTRAGVEVYAWMPVLAFDLPDRERHARLSVLRPGADGPEPAWFDYRRMSPFLPEARQLIKEIYEDLAAHAAFAGIIFHDDAYLAGDEDLAACAPQASWPDGRPIEDCNLSPEQKTAALTDFTLQLADVVRDWRPAIRTARNLYARAVLEPEAEARFSQNLGNALAAYDTTAIMAMPLMEGAERPEAWLRRLVDSVRAEPQGLERTLFELQAKDWNDDRWLPGDKLHAQMELLMTEGVLHFGYYPDDFIRGRPEFTPLFQGITTRTFPYPRER